MPSSRLAGWFIHMPRVGKRALALTVDAALCAITVWLALCLRLEEWVRLQPPHGVAIAASVALTLPLFVVHGLYAAVFRYTGWNAMLTLGRAVAIYGVLYMFAFTVVGMPGVPRTVGVIQPLLLFVAVGLSRVTVRLWLGDLYRNLLKSRRLPGVLIYGAGEAGRQLAGALMHSREQRLLGFLDDSRALQGHTLDGMPVHAPAELPGLIERHGVTDVLLAMPSAPRERRREVVDALRQYPLHVRTLPAVAELVKGRVSLSDVHELDIEDLLGRDAVQPDDTLMDRDIRGATVLVTGAGGSIGSELCRQIVRRAPRQLLLVESSEFALYAIHDELQRWLDDEGARLGLQVDLIPLLASVQIERRMGEIMATWRPQTVYHAAAYKHVPLVEHNVLEGVRNNVWGTWVCAKLAVAYKVRKFVLVSTDKAVRPTNVMGASKRLAEMVLQALAHLPSTGTCLTMVRFGNVLGSSGSVVPRFREQIARGGPITLTHPDVTRYFMTIPEAAQLVIQAGAMAQGGDVFLLDMGEPVRIMDLARRMVQLSGLRVRDQDNPRGDIEIQVTGLRPGEKLYEELLIDDQAQATPHARILRAREGYLPWLQLQPLLNDLKSAIDAGDAAQVRQSLQRLVTGYKPAGALADWVALADAEARAGLTRAGGGTPERRAGAPVVTVSVPISEPAAGR